MSVDKRGVGVGKRKQSNTLKLRSQEEEDSTKETEKEQWAQWEENEKRMVFWKPSEQFIEEEWVIRCIKWNWHVKLDEDWESTITFKIMEAIINLKKSNFWIHEEESLWKP